MTKRFIGTFAALGMLLSGAAAFAATETNNLTVSAVVTDTCEVTVGNIDFGTLENWNGAQATSNVAVNCSGTTSSVTVKVGGGLYYDHTASAGRMMYDGSANYIPYTLRFTSTGDAVGTDAASTALTMDGSNDGSLTIYGEVPKGEWEAGTYGDTAVVSVIYTGSFDPA